MSVIAIDVDGVNLMEIWLQWYNRDWRDSLTQDDITEWSIENCVKKNCGKEIFDYLKDPHIYKLIEPYDGAIDFVTKLKSHKHKIFFVTSSTPEHMGHKYQWLKKLGLVHTTDEYVEAADKSLIYADFLVDDYIKNISDFRGIGILFTQPWNKNIDWKPRASSYEEVIEYIEGGK